MFETSVLLFYHLIWIPDVRRRIYKYCRSRCNTKTHSYLLCMFIFDIVKKWIFEIIETLLYLQQRLLMAVAESAGFTFVEFLLNKLHRKVSENSHFHDDFKHKILTYIDVTKSMLPFLIHLHHAIFYWNGAYYDMVKRIVGIRYVSPLIYRIDNFNLNLQNNFSF